MFHGKRLSLGPPIPSARTGGPPLYFNYVGPIPTLIPMAADSDELAYEPDTEKVLALATELSRALDEQMYGPEDWGVTDIKSRLLPGGLRLIWCA
jgi:hypothetical protein